VRRALDETEAEYARMPLFVRLLVRRGFVKRTGLDFAAWRALLDRSDTGGSDLAGRLAALAEHYRGAPERARRGMGAPRDQLTIIEERSRARAAAVDALRAALAG
jgi:hypothetical protein